MPPTLIRPPTAVSRLPTARGRGVRPGTAITGIPRPASRLPTPKFRLVFFWNFYPKKSRNKKTITKSCQITYVLFCVL